MAAGDLAGCSHHTVAGYLGLRHGVLLPAPAEPVRRSRIIDPWSPQIEEWVDRSKALQGQGPR